MKFTFEMSEEELDAIDLVEFTKLKIGQRVRHANEGQRYCPKIGTLGTVVAHQNQGLYSWGGLCVTVDVLFDGETKTECMVYHLAKISN